MLHSIYRQSLPPSRTSPAIVIGWATTVAAVECPPLADRTQAVMRYLVNEVVRDVAPHLRMHVELEIVHDGLRITVRVPGQGAHAGDLECAEMADTLTSMGCSGGPAGREAWAELRLESATVGA